uniref:Uncharacterized protein n=1 Tax=Myoviridae sp. ctdsp2 TaxID=2826672 RepID=A0A8S5N6T1_9CAUD|nr:MAG TPA: hypothetical protein [Myoviridae sp. ctdsp2]
MISLTFSINCSPVIFLQSFLFTGTGWYKVQVSCLFSIFFIFFSYPFFRK